MKRNAYKLLIVALIVSIIMIACQDERNNFMVDDEISLVASEKHISVSVLNETYDLAVIKSGKGQSKATVQLLISETVLAEYNAANGTDYVNLPENTYQLSATEVNFSASDTRKFFQINWKYTDLIALDNDKEYVIPIQLSVVDKSLEIDEDRNSVIIHPTRSYISMKSPINPVISPSALRETATYEASIEMDKAVSAMDITVTYAIDNSLVASYNNENGTNYGIAPEGFINLPSGTSVISAGQTSTTFTYQTVSQALFTDNVLNYFDENGYIIPIRVTSVSNEAIGITEENVTYIPVSMNSKEIIGPWTVLEGEDLCYANQPGIPAASWASIYVTDRLFDGNLTTEWISWWNGGVVNSFPMTFVVDMHETSVFTKFRIGDHSTAQGNYRNYEIYVSEEYDGGNTNWNLVASGLRDYRWTGAITFYDYPTDNATLNMIAGRYLKFVILNPEYPYSGDFSHGNGKLVEVYGIGF